MPISDATDVSYLIGPVEIGTLVSAILLGCAILQGYFYHCNCQNDSCKRKAFVSHLFSLLADFLHFVFCSAMLWRLTISAFGNLQQVKAFPTSALSGTATMTAVMNILTQSYYALRLWKLSTRFILPFMVAISTIISTIVTLCCAGQIVVHGAGWLDSHRWLIILGLSSEIWGSVLITAGTAWFLHKSKSWALRNTVRKIDKLIVWTIEIGLPPRYF
ncbi:hypothetical protein CONPUDRAFT_92240 [Coniophora puteana RWD-64-598 SS2]|uniref:Integral membrane protein n=1 Tax=Coniophora puteana (strain RWD-64-598) TaxID=741705 RepID=A0A5M3MF95_CONPW|nr:uncharacterized protein CONPUDRAFT_92240 [Coniophora puteana RWD-64-598 SS2]EIW77939.1 hypothetical protein CONPUDRAFT_92240 [Coniophora puteana RWD-64-598 SS2]